MQLLLLTAEATTQRAFFYENWFFIKPFIWLFSQFMNGIMFLLDKVGIYNITLCIVLFTIVTKMLLLPLTIKQQRSTRLQSVITPEIQALQKKYAGRNDPATQHKMLAEQRAIQEKYGVSTFAGCLPMLIQMPILFALYPVIYRMETYVSYLGTLQTKLSAEQYTQMWQLFDLNLKENPGFRIWPIVIPILVAVVQFLQTKLSMATSQQNRNNENPMGSSMKIMNTVMPLMLGFFAVNMPAFLGIYWIVQSLVMGVQQVFINKALAKKSIEDLIEENLKKANRKRARKGLPPISDKATISTRNIEARQADRVPDEAALAEKEARLKAANEYYQSRSAAPGSLAAKANMVRDYNERNKK